MAHRSNQAHIERGLSPTSNSRDDVVVEEPFEGDGEQLGFQTSQLENNLKSS